ncbi:MAG: AAA family ATPase [Bacteroidales bacterium]|nr:AAA family ATPase [Bacteroidales bacterium]MCM1415413.1 AAA family ATPase [bacterium]MCM1422941.1 AAA family ATPase [bacterium]
MFRRKIYDKLVEWKKTAQGKTALLVEGARRIGKSTVVETFGKREYRTYILIDFSVASKSVRDLFEDMSDLNYFFLQLQLQYQTDLYERESLIIFDEVQLCPLARQAVKALVKDRRYDYIETGSLISIRKNVKDILIPSEERKINMFPMDYEEFRWALGDTATNGLLKACFEAGRPLGDAVHRKQLRDFRLYMLVGGMPQAVSEYIETNNFRKVDEVKRDILNLYDEDFMKIDSTGKISLLFRAVPAQLNSNAARYQVSSVIDGERADTALELIAQMKESKTVLTAYHANDPAAGLAGNVNPGKFKMFLSDTGLFVTQMFRDKEFTENIIYEKLLNDKLSANLGYLYENAVAQTLAANGKELYYHTIMNQVSRHNYEVDFLLADKNKICPVEVKSSGYKAHKSLDVFTEKFSDRILRRYLIYTKDYRKEQDMICLPIYMAQFL